MITFQLKDLSKWDISPCVSTYKEARRKYSLGEDLDIKKFLEVPKVRMIDIEFLERNIPGFIKANFKRITLDCFKRYSHLLPHVCIDRAFKTVRDNKPKDTIIRDLNELVNVLGSKGASASITDAALYMVSYDMGIEVCSYVLFVGQKILGDNEVEKQLVIIKNNLYA